MGDIRLQEQTLGRRLVGSMDRDCPSGGRQQGPCGSGQVVLQGVGPNPNPNPIRYLETVPSGRTSETPVLLPVAAAVNRDMTVGGRIIACTGWGTVKSQGWGGTGAQV